MTDRKYENGKLLDDSERITKISSLVRKTSLDEIPQLINVLLGEMSLIGPRPLYSKYLPLSNDFKKGIVVNSFYGYNPKNKLY